MTDSKISGLRREVLRGGSGTVHISNLGREVLRGGNSNVHVSCLVREVLRSGRASDDDPIINILW